MPWSNGWQNHYDEVFAKAFDRRGKFLLGVGGLLALSATTVDHSVSNRVGDGDIRLSANLTKIGNEWGAGTYPGLIAVAQLLFDFDNGLAHTEALIFSMLTTTTIKHAAQRERPNHRSHTSFPSGHTTTAVTAAASLWHAYGWKIGVPASALAVLTGAARISDRAHYLSDVITGTVIALFWSRATAVDKSSDLQPYFDLSRGVIGWEYQF